MAGIGETSDLFLTVKLSRPDQTQRRSGIVSVLHPHRSFHCRSGVAAFLDPTCLAQEPPASLPVFAASQELPGILLRSTTPELIHELRPTHLGIDFSDPIKC
jgi:hypothetical protein